MSPRLSGSNRARSVVEAVSRRDSYRLNYLVYQSEFILKGLNLESKANGKWKALIIIGCRSFQIAKASAKTFAKQKRLKFDIWVSSHASHFNMHKKHQPKDKYNPKRFIDPEGYKAKINLYQRRYLNTLKEDRLAKAK